MPFGTHSTTFADRRERLDPAGVAAINTWRRRFGIPEITGTAVHDPTGSIHEVERSQRLGDAATATRNVALAIKGNASAGSVGTCSRYSAIGRPEPNWRKR